VKKCLITGTEGFVGACLADLLVEKDLAVYGMVYGDTRNIDHLQGQLNILPCDLNDQPRVKEIVAQVAPDYVFHLAAQSFVTVSWNNPEETLRTNIIGTFYLLDSIKEAGIDPVVEIIGSSSVYGPRREDEMPLTETVDFRPSSMYAVSKVSEDMLGYFYWQVYGMKVIRVRPFNMTGPRKTGDACADFSKAVVEIERGQRRYLEVGKLDTVRDFTDGRDAARALWLLAEKGTAGEVYNLCSDQGYRMETILQKLIALSGRDIKYQVVPEKMRLSDDPIYIGDNRRLLTLGWTPRIPLETTLADLLDYWRANPD
jgi:GDP-4-dehydro-6-deoxy-D-mannose reductase